MATASGSAASRGGAASWMLVGLLALATAFAMHHEGYVRLVTPMMGLAMAGGLAVVAWLAASEGSRRLGSLFLAIFVVEYVKESIGTGSGLWAYHGNPGQYVFGVWLWVIAGSAAYALAKKIAVPLIARARLSPPRWVNAAVVLAVAAIVPATLGEYRSGAGVEFVALYAALAGAAVAASRRMSFASLAGLVLASWAVAYPSEYAGSMGSGIWTFPHDASHPPAFLVLGCWPLEIVVQVSLSAFLAAERTDMSPAGPAEETT